MVSAPLPAGQSPPVVSLSLSALLMASLRVQLPSAPVTSPAVLLTVMVAPWATGAEPANTGASTNSANSTAAKCNLAPNRRIMRLFL